MYIDSMVDPQIDRVIDLGETIPDLREISEVEIQSRDRS